MSEKAFQKSTQIDIRPQIVINVKSEIKAGALKLSKFVKKIQRLWKEAKWTCLWEIQALSLGWHAKEDFEGPRQLNWKT